MQRLLERILDFNDALTYACDVCAELDCLLSLAEAAQMFGYQRPTMVDSNIIDITQGRHGKLPLWFESTFDII